MRRTTLLHSCLLCVSGLEQIIERDTAPALSQWLAADLIALLRRISVRFAQIDFSPRRIDFNLNIC
jgi:hypothetical protein